MGDIIKFPKRNLYIVDDFYVVLALTPEQAKKFIHETEDTNEDFDVEMIDDDYEISFIKHGKIEVALWRRKPTDKEKLSFALTSREFIDQSLTSLPIPTLIDFLEDKGVKLPTL